FLTAAALLTHRPMRSDRARPSSATQDVQLTQPDARSTAGTPAATIASVPSSATSSSDNAPGSNSARAGTRMTQQTFEPVRDALTRPRQSNRAPAMRLPLDREVPTFS